MSGNGDPAAPNQAGAHVAVMEMPAAAALAHLAACDGLAYSLEVWDRVHASEQLLTATQHPDAEVAMTALAIAEWLIGSEIHPLPTPELRPVDSGSTEATVHLEVDGELHSFALPDISELPPGTHSEILKNVTRELAYGMIHKEREVARSSLQLLATLTTGIDARAEALRALGFGARETSHSDLAWLALESLNAFASGADEYVMLWEETVEAGLMALKAACEREEDAEFHDAAIAVFEQAAQALSVAYPEVVGSARRSHMMSPNSWGYSPR